MNESVARKSNANLDSATRKLAHRSVIVILVATIVGSLLPEPADLVALWLQISPHAFNYLFLALGFMGIGVALYLGYQSGGKHV